MSLPAHIQPIPRASARTLVFQQLKQWIEDGTLQPGEVLRDGEIAKALGVSRTPVREALQMLEQHGTVVTSPSKLTRVQGASPKDARLVYPPLAVLHALAAELATPRATRADIVEMVAANERLRAAVQDGKSGEARAADDLFHDVVIGLADNPLLSAAIESLRIHSRRLDSLFFKHLGPAQESYVQHSNLIAAIERGDSKAASEITRQNCLGSPAQLDGWIEVLSSEGTRS